jgi:hypothetical protein
MHEDSSGHGLGSEIGIGWVWKIGDERNVIDLGDQLGGLLTNKGGGCVWLVFVACGLVVYLVITIK